jgi:catechol 2,3-dioxygenase-like lactoylglutathione lyase family enzyme
MSDEPAIACLGFDHVDLTVNDVARSLPFYAQVLGWLGFHRKPDTDIPVWESEHAGVAIRPPSPEHGTERFDRYRVGLHHLAFRVRSRADVDRFHDRLVAAGFTVLDAPAEYPQYGDRYYAVFFADPDGMKLEVVHFPSGYWRSTQEGGDERSGAR